MRLVGIVVSIFVCGCGPQTVDGGSETSSEETGATDNPCESGEALVLDITDTCTSRCVPLPPSCGDAPSCDPACNWDLCKTVDCEGEVTCAWGAPDPELATGWACVHDFGPCNPWLDECPDGEQCVPYAPSPADPWWTSARCAPQQTAKIGEPCSRLEGVFDGIDTCEGGAVCWDVDPDTQLGTCIPLCSGAPHDPICPPGSQCVLASAMWAAFCLPPCDPLAGDCSAGYACTQIGDAFGCMPTG